MLGGKSLVEIENISKIQNKNKKLNGKNSIYNQNQEIMDYEISINKMAVQKISE